MVMKKDRRKRDIKSKLVAAIAMLMVSCIMVVSSTYAWFTLSTAPEVTGISTAIGANGNLEMALLPGISGETTYTTVTDALNAIGDAASGMTVTQKNTTWGNLVDLSDASYGLDKISLFPAKLAVTEGTTSADPDVISSYYLGTPQYGSDGRFIGLGTSASAAVHNNGTFGTNTFGVRAVGTSSGMSAHELAFRDVLSDANDAFNKAITQTKNATSQGGSALASLAVSKATGTTEFTQADVSKLNVAYSALDTAMGYVETALKQYITAYALANGGYDDTTYLAALQVMQNATLSQMASYAGGSELAGYITTLTSLRSEVTTTLSTLEGMTAETYQWADISAMVTALADIETMKLNSQPIKYYLEKDEGGQFIHINELVSNMSNLVLEVNTSGTPDTGIYAQMADFVDTYTTPVTISGISYGGITVDSLNATMKINATADSAYLPAAKTAANTYEPDAFGAGGGSSLSDFYGYIIDMAFRTNAAGSSLQLQTDATDRVYADNSGNNPATMGGGSSMTFSIAGVEGFGAKQLENLMGFIRVVFFDPQTNAVLGYARLDAETAETVGDETNGYEITMKLKMWDPAANDGQGTWASSSVITDLQQNVATAVSTLVYLDGEKLTNADVANTELSGTMNLQFSSTAELKPMDYGDLKNGNTTEQTDYTVTVNGVTLDNATVAAGATYTLTRDQYASLVPQDQTVTNITVTMGGNPVADAYDPNTGTVTVRNVSGNIVVTVTLSGSGT